MAAVFLASSSPGHEDFFEDTYRLLTIVKIYNASKQGLPRETIPWPASGKKPKKTTRQ
jgi:hypothetical protein